MRHVFRILKLIPIPDGTHLYPFLNPMDSMSNLPANLFSGFSIAAGEVKPKTSSKIHLMPFVTQVTFVRRGTLKVQMKGPHEEKPYSLQARTNQAVLTEPGTFLQLINEGSKACTLLYILSPAYVFEKSGEQVIYDDSVVLEEGWHELEAQGWHPKAQMPTKEQRQETVQRLGERSRPRGAG